MTTRPEDDVIGHYRRHGPTWAKLRGERPAEGPWLDRFCALMPAGGEVLDLGCGSGAPIARGLLDRGFAVTGVDSAPEMLALFRRNAPEAQAVLCDMRQLSLGRQFAGILAWDSFFHLSPDAQRAMFPRFAAHAMAGAPLMFTSGGSEGSSLGEFEGEILYHASLGGAEYRSLLQANGFEVVRHVLADPSCDRTVWLARA